MEKYNNQKISDTKLMMMNEEARIESMISASMTYLNFLSLLTLQLTKILTYQTGDNRPRKPGRNTHEREIPRIILFVR